MKNRNTAGNRMIVKKGGIIGPIEPRQPRINVKTVGDYPGVPKAYLEVAESYEALSGPPLCDELVALIQHMYTEDEADVIRHLKPKEAKTGAEIAERAHRPVEEVKAILDILAREKFVIVSITSTISFGPPLATRYSLIPLIPGAFETVLIRPSMDTLTDWDRRFARLYTELYDTGFTTLNLGKRPAGIRYLPVGESISAHQQAMPFDYFEEYIDRFDHFGVALCQCRIAEELAGRGCGRPKENCATMGRMALDLSKQGRGRLVEKKELVKIKAEAAPSGLVTWAMVTEMEGSSTSCSCCGCCCGALRSISEFNIPGRIAPPHFLPSCDLEKCSYCGKCALVCPMGAITIDTKGKTRTFARERCIGCGLCVVKCEKEKALSLVAVPDYQPPEINFIDHFFVDIHE